MNKTLRIEYETFEEVGIIAMSVIDVDSDELINILRDDEAEELYNKLTTIAE